MKPDQQFPNFSVPQLTLSPAVAWDKMLPEEPQIQYWKVLEALLGCAKSALGLRMQLLVWPELTFSY